MQCVFQFHVSSKNARIHEQILELILKEKKTKIKHQAKMQFMSKTRGNLRRDVNKNNPLDLKGHFRKINGVVKDN